MHSTSPIHVCTDVPFHSVDPTNSNEFKEPNEQQRHTASKLVKQGKQVHSVTKNEGDAHYEEYCTHDSCRETITSS